MKNFNFVLAGGKDRSKSVPSVNHRNNSNANLHLPGTLIEFFTVCTKLAEMAILYSKDLTTAKKMLPPVGLDLML